MKPRTIVFGLGVIALSALVSTQAISGDKPGQGKYSPEDMAKMMQEWMALAAPGEHHKLLEPFVGQWNTVTKTWWGGPGSDAVQTNGTTEVKWILGGRYLMDETKSEFMMPTPTGEMKSTPYHGVGFTGYDNFRNMYVGVWMDDMGTQMLTMKGTAVPSGKVFTFYGEMDEPAMNMVGRTVKYVTRIINNDKHVFEIYDLPAGDDYKVMEITYTRRR